MKQLITLLFCSIFYSAGFAQTISFHFPHLKGNKYMILLHKGLLNDTIQQGTIEEDGHFSFTLPEKENDYSGIINLSVEQLFNQNFILNNESFSIAGTEPMMNNLIFSGTKENDFLKNQIDIQQKILRKTEAFYHFRDAYSDDTSLTAFLEKEFSKLAGLYANHRQELAQSEQYAAHYLELIYFLNGFGSRLYPFKQVAENRDDAIRFISDQLSMDVLYSSGLWNYVISSTFELYTDKIVFGQDMIKNLQRTRSQKVFDTLANDLITICEQFGWIGTEDTIVSYLASSGRLKNVQQNLSVAMELNKVKPGSKAIPIQGIKNLANTLLIFYESGCPLCSDQLKEIKEYYPQLKEKKIRVLSIASDRSKEIYEEMANTFPWPDKLCDFEGFEGKNFRNYGILGTPTIYVIDKKGYVVGRYAKLRDTGL